MLSQGILQMLSHWPPASQSSTFDKNSPTHRLPTKILHKICYWTGAGNDSYWTTPENWSEKTLPTLQDEVRFDQTSTKDIIINIPIHIHQLTITADYTGTITGWQDLVITENATIAGGLFHRNLIVGGNLTITGGQMKSYLSVGGDLTIAGGHITWQGGEVKGKTTFQAGIVLFSGAYNHYYTFYGDVVQIHTILRGKPAFSFQGQNVQHFHCGTQLLLLRDLSNSSQLQIHGHLKIEEFFTNYHTLIIPINTLLDASKAVSYHNQGQIIQTGQVLYPSQSVHPQNITDCSRNKV